MSDYFNGTGTIGFTCDNCGRELLGCTWVNGMRFCAKCYQEIFGNTNSFEKELRDKIADLELKLAEKETRIAELEDKDWYEATIKQLEKQNERLIKERDGNYENYSICWKENEQLKQQLAEKDKEIARLKLLVDGFDKLKQYDKDADLILINPKTCYTDGKELIIKSDNQDKISFAVDILEELADCSNYINSKLDFESGSYVSEKSIRDKIKYLKGNKYE